MSVKFVMRSLTLAAGERKRVGEIASFFMLVSNTGTLKVKISIDDEPLSDIPTGYEYREPKEDSFYSHIDFQNPNAGSVTIEYIMSSGIVRSSPTIIALDEILASLLVANTITTPEAVTALDASYLIDNAAAVDKGGGKVGIPVTGHPFETGEVITIANTVNYNAVNHVVDGDSTVNEVVIVYGFSVETFDGTNDSIGLTNPRNIPADTTQREVILQNNGSVDVWFGDTNVAVSTERGTKVQSGDVYILDLTAAVYFVSDTAGKSGATVSLNRLQRA